MPKPQSDKEWQERNPVKVKAYKQKYMQNKKSVTLILNASTVEAIEKVKQEGQTASAWIRNFLEEWENTHDTI